MGREHDLIFGGCIRRLPLVEQNFRKLRTLIRQPGKRLEHSAPVADSHVQRRRTSRDMRSRCASTNRRDVRQVPVRKPLPLWQSLRLDGGSPQVLHSLLSGRLSSGVMQLFREGRIGSKRGHGLGHVEFVPRRECQSLGALARSGTWPSERERTGGGKASATCSRTVLARR